MNDSLKIASTFVVLGEKFESGTVKVFDADQSRDASGWDRQS
jgi:hypothetical protein